ncbi:metalloendopeptidase [Yamadazyma tenuis]|uniref:Peptidase M3A/M3B catalytic domain-containing protein n=1 Tax=Candida tenuis (strain ATCC 10573 / BCRC 21748 / CBS 615 / JCM 9827 / NBRC 10315 / NRRL Y-1498 / VKM Y-70) TaxID=590646 RepID=G3AZC1_CANTC|nr:uncharacterized protein CANTEDRAFT_119196 [Yamadazyma tenuis ATCC 10573]EGV66059.1 hypothetical protein CANTEDRAFT_119196 [Yamadazyma tenuis ATCC 10573]WEJ95597.1 metalloendopeptidase [Yamadazyma tenuis]
MSEIDYDNLISKLSLPRWDHTPSQVLQKAEDLIRIQDECLNKFAAVENPTTENALAPYLQTVQEIWFSEGQLTFYSSVSPQKDVRDASNAVSKKLDKYSIEASQRKDVYKVFKKLAEAKHSDPETTRYLDKKVLGYQRNGMELPDDQQEVLKNYKLQLSELAIEFKRALNEIDEYIAFTREELEGVPDDVVDQFQIDGGKYKMTFKYTDFFPVMKYAKNQDTRKRAYIGNQSKCANNGTILLNMLKLRYRVAKLLNYDHYSAFVLEERIAKTSDNVLTFLHDLRAKLTPLGKQQLQHMKELKYKDLRSRELSPQDDFYIWDQSFYDNLLLEKEYQVDHKKIQEYFPLDLTIKRMLSIYETIFDIKFHKLANLPVEFTWHSEVKQFAVFQNIKSGNPSFVGIIYFDLHPREGKYGHAANFNLGPGFEKGDGTRQYPVTALVCNFTKPSKDKPALLKHSELKTFFHELGHGVHSILSKTKYAKFHGTRVPRDFVEAPSQMLEYWIWSQDELKALSSHYQTGEPISDELLGQLIKSKSVNRALLNLRQVFLGLFDMKCHTIDNEEDLETFDLLSTWNDMRGDISLIPADAIRTPGYASFRHIALGYSSSYYGYLYSQVFAADMFYSLFKKDPMNIQSGLRYRDVILSTGNSREIMESLEELLGRKPTNTAFLKELLG